ncbi:hypothetical protein niasHS_008753 [Heterodera schachtii]|uniref:BACK domain-containing protein n=1 Tax=Heterodera schachtii TaxID=97005 RepID=A0ABD2J9Y9_HETSC
MSSSWQDRFKLMLSTGEGADVHFLVGKEKEASFPQNLMNVRGLGHLSPTPSVVVKGAGVKELLKAHKCVMMFASDVFGSMFRFDDKNAKTKSSADCPRVIEVTDVEAEAFKGFSRHCLDYIDKNAKTLFESEEFLQIDQNLLCEIIGRNQLKIDDELTIWNAALRWADKKCRQNAIENFAENRRAVLGPALFKIRFPLITKRKFSLNIVSSCVLTMEEQLAVLQYHCHPNLRGAPGQYPMAFPCHGRFSDRKQGTLSMDIEKLSEFAREKVNSFRLSEGIYSKGLPWKILAKIKTKENSTEKWLGFFLLCTAPKENGNWSCKCFVTFRIVSQKSETEDFTKEMSGSQNSFSMLNKIAKIKELMDPSKEFYDSEADKVSLAIDFIVEEEKGTKRKLTDE